ncbi:Cu+-exporting ATPase [Flavobacteriaceae bacterium MAR_2010_188]|nr:Cu+-exporting ATPase [Flavobacteriaceae bacterium MAR_2010_188]
MKNLKYFLFLFTLSVALFSCKNSEPEVITVDNTTNNNKEIAMDANADYAKAEFGIKGMTCAMGCAKSIENKLAKMDGVKSAKVDFEHEVAMVEYNEAKVTPKSLEEAVASAGNEYKVTEMKTVDSFSSAKSCDMECCAGKTAEEKANCEMACCKA